MGKLRKVVEVNACPEAVFAYLDDVHQRGQHMLGMGRRFELQILSEKPTGIGATYRWRGSMFGWRFDWTEVVTKWVENKEKAHHSIKGLKIDSNWTLTPKNGGTIVTMNMEYDLGYSWFGKLIDWIFAERYCSKGLDKDLAYMKEVLEKPMEGVDRRIASIPV